MDRASPACDVKDLLNTISLENLIEGFPAWWHTFSDITRHPFRFASSLPLAAPNVLRPALRYALYSILVAFLVTAPVFLVHHTKMNKILFLSRLCTQFLIFGAALHYSLRLLGAKRTFPGSLASYLYIGSTGMQLYLAIALPWLLRLGPDAIFGGWSESERLVAQMQSSAWPWSFGVVAELFGLASLYFVLRWFATTHQLRKRRVFLAMTLTGFAGGALQLFVVAPLFQFLEKSVGGILDLF